MNRARFLAAAAAGAATAGAPAAGATLTSFSLIDPLRVGARLSLAEMMAQYPVPVSGDLLQYELGFGAKYDKQIGFGHEPSETGPLLFVESQVGNGDHACNPNTLKKVYLKHRDFANLFTPYPASTYITRSGNMLARWGDGVGAAAANLLLLDAKALYDPRKAIVTGISRESVTVDGKRIDTTRVAAHYNGDSGEDQLQRVALWLSPAIPLGLVKMTATSPDIDPFHLSVYKFARHFKTELAMSLGTVRALTPTGDGGVVQ